MSPGPGPVETQAGPVAGQWSFALRAGRCGSVVNGRLSARDSDGCRLHHDRVGVGRSQAPAGAGRTTVLYGSDCSLSESAQWGVLPQTRSRSCQTRHLSRRPKPQDAVPMRPSAGLHCQPAGHRPGNGAVGPCPQRTNASWQGGPRPCSCAISSARLFLCNSPAPLRLGLGASSNARSQTG